MELPDEHVHLQHRREVEDPERFVLLQKFLLVYGVYEEGGRRLLFE